MRAEEPLKFALAMLERERLSFERAKKGETTVYDRGFADIVGFLRLESMPIPTEVDEACRGLRYSGPIFRAPPWREIFQQDSERIQNWKEALASDAAVTRAWHDFGYDLIDLPLTAPSERASFVLDRL